MTQLQDTLVIQAVQGALLDDPDFLKVLVERVVQQMLESEMGEHLRAESYERTDDRRGYRNGYKPRTHRKRSVLGRCVQGPEKTRAFRRRTGDVRQPRRIAQRD